MKKTYLIFLLLLGNIAFAQEVTWISQEEAITKALENNNNIKIIAEQVNESKADYQQSSVIFIPNISASYTGITTTNPLMAFGSKLNQEIVSQSDFNPQLLNDPSRTTNFATKIEIQQPLINIDGFYKRKAAKAKFQATEMQYERTKEYIALETKKAYMQLQLAYKMVTVLEKAKEAASANLKLAENSFKQGYLQKADVLAVKVRVTEVENQLQLAKSNIHNASNYLSVLVNDTSFSILQPSDSLLVEGIRPTATKLSNDRADIKAMEYASMAYEKMYKAEKMNFLPRLNAFGSYELYDNEIFQADASGYLVGANLSWNILEGAQRFAKSKKSKASFEKSKVELDQYKMESQMALNQAERMLQDAENSLQLSKLALEQSEESLRIRSNRFKEGLEKTRDLLMAETQYAQKQLEYYQTIFQYNYAKAYVTFLTQE
ncbi:MAG: TolC family protein [Flavobacteriaceae bacterium]|nr:TolC family protein [Flavobacteriaceae bacterium]